ncbi:DNA ligase (NAD(+)) LigA [Candidatus Epulonipiscioides gigas]|nr:DNA ligase (NAD(+)) LigA [Epulopiscium sp. SCG-C07WGA-EpuloA2]
MQKAFQSKKVDDLLDKLQEMKELVELLDRANFAYEQQNQEIMSNFEYDSLVEKLEKLEKELGIIYSHSVTQTVGYTISSELSKKAHLTPMLSLNKTKDIEALKNFLGEQEGLLSYKLDGLTVVMKYNNGNLEEALTRGNGQIGEDVTENAKTFKNLPLKINFNGSLVIRGEAIITYQNFEKINKLEDNKYKNPRNLCSGTVRQLDSSITAKRNVNFICFAIVESNQSFITKQESLNFLKEQGFSIIENEIVTAETLEETVTKFTNNIKEKDFQADGLVLSFNNIDYSKNQGATSKFPKDSIAYKWQDIQEETVLTAIEWNTSRTGQINPVAIFSPIELEGTTVMRASVHNVSILEDLKLGLGDTITIYKANMIIPQIGENLSRTGPVSIPNVCNACGGDTVIEQENKTKTLYCNNYNCPAKRIKKLTHFVSRNAMNIEGLSEATLEKLPINDISEIYDIENYKDKIIQLKGFGEKSYLNLAKSINKSRKVPLYKFLYALGILHVGISNAKLICEHFDNSLDKIRNATEKELTIINGIGPKLAKELYNYFNNNENKLLLEKLLQKIEFEQELKEQTSKLTNQNFVITGELKHFKNRQELQLEIEKNDGKVTNSVTKNTSYLINNDLNSNSSKNKKAKELKIPIIDEDTFLNMLYF